MECGTKVRHATRESAIAHLKNLVWINHARHQDELSKGLDVYPCSRCFCFHVGHRAALPLVWHYTIIVPYLDRILASDALKPAKPKRPSQASVSELSPEGRAFTLAFLGEREPLLWFSRNPDWEYSVRKVSARGADDDDMHAYAGRAMTELVGRGLLRFGVPASVAKLRWGDYLARNPTPKMVRQLMTQYGNPTEWLATDEPVPLKYVRAIQVYYRGAWVDVDSVSDDDFDAYIVERPAVYRSAMQRLIEGGREHRTLDEAEQILVADETHGNVQIA